jgi:hypothetical protein
MAQPGQPQGSPVPWTKGGAPETARRLGRGRLAGPSLGTRHGTSRGRAFCAPEGEGEEGCCGGSGGGSAVEGLDGGTPDADAGVGEPGVDAGEGHACHADQGRLLELRRVCRARNRGAGSASGTRAGTGANGRGRTVCWKGLNSGAGRGRGRGLTWVIEVLDEPVLEHRQRLGAEVAFLPPVSMLLVWSGVVTSR